MADPSYWTCSSNLLRSFFGGAASVFAEAFSTSLKGDGFQNTQGNRVIERERGKRRRTGAKWKGHIYKVRVQRDSRPNQIASTERDDR